MSDGSNRRVIAKAGPAAAAQQGAFPGEIAPRTLTARATERANDELYPSSTRSSANPAASEEEEAAES